MKAVIQGTLRRIGYEFRRIESLPQVRAQGTVVEWPHDGRPIRFYVENRFDLIGKDMFNGRFFEQEELDFLRGIADPTGAFLDIGANVGNHTVYFAAVIGARSVHSFEPGDFAYPRLAFNVALNGLEDQVRLHRLALSNRDGAARMRFTFEDNHGTLAIVSDDADGEGGDVRIARGDAVIGTERVSFVKVDAERHEFEVLAGLAEIIARDRPLVMVEVLLAERDTMQAWMDANGYTEVGAFPRYGDIVNIVAGPKG